MEGMPRPRPPHIQREVTRHGKVKWYFRRARGSRRVRLPDEYGSKEFWKAYNAALAGHDEKPVRAEKETLAWVVAQYKTSSEWQILAPSTKRVRDRLMQTICKRAGDAPVKHITRLDLQAGVDQRASKPQAANAFLKTMRAVLAHAVRLEIVERNVALDVPLLEGSAEGFHTWTLDEIARYEATFPVGTQARLAMDLMLYAGLRLGDLAQIGHQHIRDGMLHIRPEKTRRSTNIAVTIRVLPPLAESIAATPTGPLHLIVSSRGQPFVKEALGNRIKKWCRQAGIPHCSAHGLRKASATRAAEAGATTHELMAMFGWTTTKEAERYTKAADRRRMGVSGSEKLVQMSRTDDAGAGQNSKSDV